MYLQNKTIEKRYNSQPDSENTFTDQVPEVEGKDPTLHETLTSIHLFVPFSIGNKIQPKPISPYPVKRK